MKQLEEINKEIIKLARMLEPSAIRNEYNALKQIHEILRLISEVMKLSEDE